MITFNELQQVGSVQEKQDRSEDRALWYSIDNYRWRRTGRRSADVLNSVAEIRRKPVDDFPVETVGPSQPLKERVMVNAVKCCWQVEKCQHHEVAGVQCQQYVGQDLKNCRLCRVVRSVRRLKVRKKIIVLEISQKLFTDYSLQQLRDDWQVGDRSIRLGIGRI